MDNERVKLRDFQEALTGKLGRAGEMGPALLGVEAGGERWLVDLKEAGEVLPLPPLIRVPLTRSWFAGLANIRGTLYGVTDLGAFHGADPTPQKQQSRLLLAGGRGVGSPGGNSALLVAKTYGLVSMETLKAVPDEAAAGPVQAWRGERYRAGDGQAWTQLLLSVLLSAPEFLDVAV